MNSCYEYFHIFLFYLIESYNYIFLFNIYIYIHCRSDHHQQHQQHHQTHHTHHQKNNQLQPNDCKSDIDKKKPHIKKPLNAFMLYMKEMRAKVVAECTLKESAAINQILGRRVSYKNSGQDFYIYLKKS